MNKRIQQARFEAKAAQLEALYASLPKLECKGKCGWDICGPITMTELEWRRIYRQVEDVPEPQQVCYCPFFDVGSGKCGVYSVRPLICRLFGLVDNDKMRCQYGCEPERWLTDQEAFDLLAEAYRISTGPEYKGDFFEVAKNLSVMAQ